MTEVSNVSHFFLFDGAHLSSRENRVSSSIGARADTWKKEEELRRNNHR